MCICVNVYMCKCVYVYICICVCVYGYMGIIGRCQIDGLVLIGVVHIERVGLIPAPDTDRPRLLSLFSPCVCMCVCVCGCVCVYVCVWVCVCVGVCVCV
jgi:hypothetical protein